MGRLIAVVVCMVVMGAACGGAPEEDRAGPLAAVAEIDVGGRDHVLGEVAYPSAPPAGGDHFVAWQNCGFYDQPIIDEVAVHSLEHGAVWVAYAPDTDEATRGAISARADRESHLLASPYAGLAAPLVLTAWGRQLSVDEWDDPATESFLDQYLGRRSPTAPEAGVSCSGAIGSPPSDPLRGYQEAIAAVSGGN